MLNASYTTPTASNNKVVSMTTNCLIVRFIGHHPGGEKPPPTRRIAADGGNPWRYEAPSSYYGLTHASPMPIKESSHQPVQRKANGRQRKRAKQRRTLTSPDISCQSESFLAQLQRPHCIILGYPHQPYEVMASLLRNNPELAKEWHPTKNGSLEPADLTPGSNKKVWWVCVKGHEWQARVTDRNYRKTGCPYCSGYRVCIDNCLYTINPTLASQWHPTKNDPLTPKDVTPGFSKKVWWICSEGQEWEAVVNTEIAAQDVPTVLDGH